MGTIKASKHCWPVYRTAARLGCIVAYPMAPTSHKLEPRQQNRNLGRNRMIHIVLTHFPPKITILTTN